MRVGQTNPMPPASAGAARRSLPLLLLLFAGSGCAALIYEIVWYQLLQLVIGSTAVSLGVLLATFMGGLCLGSLLLPRLQLAGAASAARLRQDRTRHRGLRHSRALPDAAGGLGLHLRGRTRPAGDPAARAGLRALPAAADLPDGRVAAGGVALDQGLPGRRLVAGHCSTAPTWSARFSAACSPASTCCASSTWRPRPTSPRRSMSRSGW